MRGRRNAVGNKGGQPGRYQPEYARLVYHYCLLGAVDQQLAEFFSISLRTLHHWKKRHVEFSESVKAGKSIADAKVAKALYQLAIGYSHPDTYISVYNGQVVLTPTIKHYPPNVTAAIFWLKNRQSAHWSERPKTDSSRPAQVYIRREETTGDIVIDRYDDGSWVDQLEKQLSEPVPSDF
ncbi:terminase [Spirosoma sp. BT704]|uniref:Terminase n=2 Tax=Spirosoma validum TaxID=2771355 RepID=A0A927AZI9_9BACT|nr:terminase [Spirosoma validum]